jgi:toxin ParE1/3/4
MTNQVRRTRLARLDFADIFRTIARTNPVTARRFVSKIERECDRHACFPLTGEARDDLGPDLRVFSVSSYVVIYRPIEDGIEVIRIVHGARDLPGLFAE